MMFDKWRILRNDSIKLKNEKKSTTTKGYKSEMQVEIIVERDIEQKLISFTTVSIRNIPYRDGPFSFDQVRLDAISDQRVMIIFQDVWIVGEDQYLDVWFLLNQFKDLLDNGLHFRRRTALQSTTIPNNSRQF